LNLLLEKKINIHKGGYNPTYLFIHLVYVVFLLLIGGYSYIKPAYNWDLLPYMGVLLSYDQGHGSVHHQVYSMAREQMPEATYHLLTDSNDRHRGKMAADSNAFMLQMPFYVVKPLYTRIGYVFYKAGLPLTKSAVLPSILAHFFLCLLMLHWLKRYLSLLVAAALSLLLALWGPLLMASKLAAPDCLSALLLLCALYSLVEKGALWTTCLFLLLSIFARIDNILPCFFILWLLVIAGRSGQKLKPVTCLLMVSAAVLCYLLACLQVREFGWSLGYYPSFYPHLNPEYDMQAPFSFASYIALAKSQFMTGLYYSNVVLFAVLTVLYFLKPGGFLYHRLSLDQLLVLLFWLLITVRFILQPVVADRFYLAYYLCLLVFLVRKHRSATYPDKTGSNL